MKQDAQEQTVNTTNSLMLKFAPAVINYAIARLVYTCMMMHGFTANHERLYNNNSMIPIVHTNWQVL